MSELYDPAVDLMRKRLREKALADLEAKSAELDATTTRINPDVARYVAKRNNIPLPPLEPHGPEYSPEEMPRPEGPAYNPVALGLSQRMDPTAAAPVRPQAPAPAQDDSALADEYANRAGLVAGLGRGASKIAASVSGRKADSSAWDQIGQTAETRRAAVMDYMRKKSLGKEEYGRDLEKIGLQQKGQKELAGLNNAADMEKTKYVQGEEMRRLQAQLAVEKEKAARTGDAAKVKQIQDQEDTLRKELMGNQVTKDALAVSAQFEGIKGALGRNTPAGHMAGVFMFMKALDPTSSVRETEYANAKNAAGVPDQIRNLYNQTLSGTLLNDGQIKDFIGTVQAKLNSQVGEYNKLKSGYVAIAPPGASPRNIAPLEFDAAQSAGAEAPPQNDTRPKRTDPATGETRVWNGTAWVRG